MQLANHIDDLHRVGVDIVAITVDEPGRNEAMRRRWELPFPIVSDPGGETYLQPMGLWNPDERGGIGVPAIVVLDQDGDEVGRLVSRDFADRPPELSSVIALAATADLAPITHRSPWADSTEPTEDPGAFRTDAFGTYFRAIQFATRALSSRLTDPGDIAEAKSMQAMCAEFLNERDARRRDSPSL